MYSKPGTPCNDYNGYCDVFQMCREVDPSGPLATLRKMLLSEESIASFKKWVMDYWYAVLLIILTVIALLVFSTKFLGKRSNGKLKSITVMHSQQPTETVKLPNADGQVTVHPQLRSKLPLKKKVRNGKKIKRQHNGSPSKSKVSPKKKKRVSAAVAVEDNRKKVGDSAAVIEIPPSKVKRSQQSNVSKKKKKKKEVIDYSGVQNDQDGKKGLITAEVVHNPVTPEVTDPVGKVQNWLLKSHHAALPKSKSTPAGLTDKANRSPHKRPTIRPKSDKSKSHSIGNLPNDKDKVRLQVVYKPPFKFSVKLKKPNKTVPNPSATKPKASNNTRTAVLVRTVKDREPKFKKNTVKPSEEPVIVT
ncbi:hypothetical protein AMK59_4262, partial [Oryctes borbonicus]